VVYLDIPANASCSRFFLSLSVTHRASTTIAAGYLNSTFPFHTEPEFEISAGFVDGMGGIMAAAFAPLVTNDQRDQWEAYAVEHQGWIQQSDYLTEVHPQHLDALHGTLQDPEHDQEGTLSHGSLHGNDEQDAHGDEEHGEEHEGEEHEDEEHEDEDHEDEHDPIPSTIYRWNEMGQNVPEVGTPGQLLAPLWQVSPLNSGAVNANLLADPRVSNLYTSMLQANEGVVGGNKGVLSSNFEVGNLVCVGRMFWYSTTILVHHMMAHAYTRCALSLSLFLLLSFQFNYLFKPEDEHLKKEPHAFILQPVYGDISENAAIVGFFLAITPFGSLLHKLLPEGQEGIVAVLKDDCGNVMSFRLTWAKTIFMGYEDLHEPEFDDYVHVERNLEQYDERLEGLCTHDMYLYPSARMRSLYDTTAPLRYTSLVATAFAIMICLFGVFDQATTRRQDKTMVTALEHRAIVTSLFPAEMGKRMIEEAQNAKLAKAAAQQRGFRNDEMSLKNSDATTNDYNRAQSQMAQLYTEATVMFADLVGFTAWSSMHEPPEVFHLLETLYAAFDRIAKKRSVFKVETIGDCVSYGTHSQLCRRASKLVVFVFFSLLGHS
jgi:hypothetical protein